jgi:hypothetical protein
MAIDEDFLSEFDHFIKDSRLLSGTLILQIQ